MSTLSMQALDAFQKVLSSTSQPHRELVTLEAAGWQEGYPSEDWWHFTHPDFPGISVNWSPGQPPWTSGQGVA